MKNISKSLKKKIVFATLCLLFSAGTVSAQDPFDENVNDEPAAPIDGFLIAGLIAGSAFGISKIRKNQE